MKQLRKLLFQIFYIVTSSWLERSRWLKVWLYQSYLNPALIVALVGFVCHPSLPWLVAIIIAVVLTTSVITRADAQCSIKHMTEAYEDILEGDNFLIEPLAADSFLFSVIQESSNLRIYEHLENTLQNNPFYHNIFRNSLRVFVAEGRNGQILDSPKAYTNFLGQSLIFLNRAVEQEDAIDCFIVLHELEHINLDGARQLSRIYSRPMFLVFSTILLCFLTISWWHWIFVVFYISLHILAYLQSKIKREVIADNAALIKLSNNDLFSSEVQKEVVEYFIEYNTENLENATNLETESINILTWEEHPFHLQVEEIRQRNKIISDLRNQGNSNNFIKEQIDRLRHWRWYEYSLNQDNSLPYLGWTSFWDNIGTVPFVLFFLYLGVVTSSPPLFPFGLMLIFIVVDMFLFLGYMKKFQMISETIENSLAKNRVHRFHFD